MYLSNQPLMTGEMAKLLVSHTQLTRPDYGTTKSYETDATMWDSTCMWAVPHHAETLHYNKPQARKPSVESQENNTDYANHRNDRSEERRVGKECPV